MSDNLIVWRGRDVLVAHTAKSERDWEEGRLCSSWTYCCISSHLSLRWWGDTLTALALAVEESTGNVVCWWNGLQGSRQKAHSRAGCVGETQTSSKELILAHEPLHVNVRQKTFSRVFVLLTLPAALGIVPSMVNAQIQCQGPGEDVCKCVCRHVCVMFKRICVCTSIWGVIAGSLLVWENHTSCSLPTPCQGQDLLTAPHCYFFMFVKCGISMHMHTYTQMLSAVPIFSDTSHSQVRQSLSTRCRQTPLWNLHTRFHSPISKPSTFFPINSLNSLFAFELFLNVAARKGSISKSTSLK